MLYFEAKFNECSRLAEDGSGDHLLVNCKRTVQPYHNEKSMMEVEDYPYKFGDSQREIMLFVHHLLVNELNLTAKIRFNIPFYFRKSWICYLNPGKKNTVEFAFIRGNELSNSQKLLDSKGRKQVWSIELTKLSNIPVKELTEIIQEAILLDEIVPYASKRKKLK